MKKLKVFLSMFLAIALIFGSIAVLNPVEAKAASKSGVTCSSGSGAKINEKIKTVSESLAGAKDGVLLAKGLKNKGYISVKANEDGDLVLTPSKASEGGAKMSVYLDKKFTDVVCGAVGNKWDKIKHIADGTTVTIPMSAGETVYIKCEWGSKSGAKNDQYNINITAGFVPMSKLLMGIDTGMITSSSSGDGSVEVDIILAKGSKNATTKWTKGNVSAKELSSSSYKFTSDSNKTWASKTKVSGPNDNTSAYKGSSFRATNYGFKPKDGALTGVILFDNNKVCGVVVYSFDARIADSSNKKYVVKEPLIKIKGSNTIAGYTLADELVEVKVGRKQYTVRSNSDGLYVVVLKSNLKANEEFSIWIDGFDYLAQTYSADVGVTIAE